MTRKPIFDCVRQMLGRAFTDADVLTLDRAIDKALGVEPKGLLIGPKGVELIKAFEGCKLDAYPDPGTGDDPWTIGWGATHMDGRRVRKGDSITAAKADGLLHDHLQSYASEVRKAIGDAPTTQDQFDAMVSWAYNVGPAAAAKSTLMRKHKAGDYEGAAREFARWNRAGGRPMAGLTRRRKAEAELYSRGRP